MADFDQIFAASNFLDTLLASIDHCTVIESSREARKLLLDYSGIDLAPALKRCIQRGRLDVLVQLLRDGVSIDESVVQCSAQCSNTEYLDTLLDYGWPINKPLQNGTLASVLCYAGGDENLLERLLQRGADPNALSNVGETPITIAVREGSQIVVQQLLDSGGNIGQGDLLHAAVQRDDGRPEMIDLLVSYGVPLNTIQWQHPVAASLRAPFLRGTPLHLACTMGRVDAVRALLQHGADPYSKQQRYQEAENTTPFDLARREGNTEIAGIFEEMGVR